MFACCWSRVNAIVNCVKVVYGKGFPYQQNEVVSLESFHMIIWHNDKDGDLLMVTTKNEKRLEIDDMARKKEGSQHTIHIVGQECHLANLDTQLPTDLHIRLLLQL